MISILSKIKLWHILLIAFIVLVAATTHYRSKYISEKETSKIRKENFINLMKLQKLTDSMQVVQLKFQTQREIENYIEQNEDLKYLLKKQGIEKDKVNSLILSQQTFIDSLKKSFNASKLVDNIRNDIPGVFTFKDSTKCINVEGDVSYKDNLLDINITKKEITSKILLTESKGRRKPVKWLLGLRLGKREINKTATTNCGNVDVQIIEKVNKTK